MSTEANTRGQVLEFCFQQQNQNETKHYLFVPQNPIVSLTSPNIINNFQLNSHHLLHSNPINYILNLKSEKHRINIKEIHIYNIQPPLTPQLFL